MKKILILLVSIISFGVCKLAYADMMPSNMRHAEKCVKIVNLDKFPDTKLLGRDTYTGSSENIYVINNNECLPSLSYKFNSFTVLLATEDYLKSIDGQDLSLILEELRNNYINYVDNDRMPLFEASEKAWSKIISNENIITIDSSINPGDLVVNVADPLEKEIIEYSLLKDENNNFILKETKHIYEYNDGTPTKIVENFDNINDIFSDVPSYNSVNYDAIKYLKDNDIVEGYADGTFKPNQKINRAEFVKILMEIVLYDFDWSNFDDDNVCFPDLLVKDEEIDLWTRPWYFYDVCQAKEAGLINGYPDGTFKASENINFVEASKIIVKAFQYEVASSDDGIWYKPYVEELTKRMAIPSTIDSFDKEITRGEMAEMIWRLKNNVVDKPSGSYYDLNLKSLDK